MRVFTTTKSAKRSAFTQTHDRGTATAGAAATITLSTDAAASFLIDNDPKIVGSVIVVVAGTGSFEAKNVASYVAATRVATMAANWPTPPDATSVYRIMHPTAAMELTLDKAQFSGVGKAGGLDRLATLLGEEARESSLIS
jgi:hypothetical protein